MNDFEEKIGMRSNVLARAVRKHEGERHPFTPQGAAGTETHLEGKACEAHFRAVMTSASVCPLAPREDE